MSPITPLLISLMAMDRSRNNSVCVLTKQKVLSGGQVRFQDAHLDPEITINTVYPASQVLGAPSDLMVTDPEFSLGNLGMKVSFGILLAMLASLDYWMVFYAKVFLRDSSPDVILMDSHMVDPYDLSNLMSNELKQRSSLLRTDGSWVCLRCDSEKHYWNAEADTWTCSVCGNAEFCHAQQPTKRQTDRGTWMFLPAGVPVPSDAPPDQPELGQAGPRRRRKRQQRRGHGGPPDAASERGEGRGESEVPTVDPFYEDDAEFDLPPRPPQHGKGANKGYGTHGPRSAARERAQEADHQEG